MRADHRGAYARFRQNRYSDRHHHAPDFDWGLGWPGLRYIALHTLSHLLIRTIALECGYSSASLSERIYAGTDGRSAQPASSSTPPCPTPRARWAGWSASGEPTASSGSSRRALSDARDCSSDPLCAERLPAAPADFLHGAACHVCLFVSETTCERGNRFLDRRFVVPIDEDPALAYWAEA